MPPLFVRQDELCNMTSSCSFRANKYCEESTAMIVYMHFEIIAICFGNGVAINEMKHFWTISVLNFKQFKLVYFSQQLAMGLPFDHKQGVTIM